MRAQDESNYHLVQSISSDGVITTETGLQLVLPQGVKMPSSYESGLAEMMVLQEEQEAEEDDGGEMMMAVDHGSGGGRQQQQYCPADQKQQQQHHHHHSGAGSRNHHHHNSNNSNHKAHKDSGQSQPGNYTYQTSNPAKPFSDYVGLPPRPPPHMPFTLSSQLYTPELAIGLTDRGAFLSIVIFGIIIDHLLIVHQHYLLISVCIHLSKTLCAHDVMVCTVASRARI